MVTNDFLGLNQDERKCQNEEPLTNCTTKQYLDTLRGECGCFPVNLGLLQKVIFKNSKICIFDTFQETLCTSPQELDCVNNVKVDTSSCLKSCSGLIVTSFAKSELKTDLETLFPIFKEYNKYKKVTSFPSGANGLLA